MPAFAEQMQVEVADLWQEGVRVAREAFAPFAVAPDQRVMLRQVRAVAAPFEVVTA